MEGIESTALTTTPARRRARLSRMLAGRVRGMGFTLGLAALIIAPCLVLTLLLSERSDDLARVYVVAWLLSSVLLLFGAMAHYGYYRLSGITAYGWLAAVLSTIAAHTVPIALVGAVDPSLVGFFAREGDLADLLPVATVLVLLLAAGPREQVSPSVDPLLLGGTLGLGSAALHLWHQLATGGAAILLASDPAVLVTACLAVLGLGATLTVWRMTSLRRRVRRRLVIAGASILAAYGLHLWSAEFDQVRGAIHLVLTLLGAAVLAVDGLQNLGHALRAQQRRLRALARRAERAEADHERDEEILHEVRATVAGVNAATRLLRDNEARLDSPRRRHLAQMLDAEIVRLQQMLRDEPPPIAEVALDDVVGPLVASTRALGVEVDWHPSGITVVTGRVRLAEVVHVLLTNAAHHAPGSPIRVRVETVPGQVVICVRDHGPGVQPDAQESIFQRGTRGATSTGQGIGLCAARRLIQELNGSLSLEPVAEGHGACFVVRLPHPPVMTLPVERPPGPHGGDRS